MAKRKTPGKTRILKRRLEALLFVAIPPPPPPPPRAPAARNRHGRRRPPPRSQAPRFRRDRRDELVRVRHRHHRVFQGVRVLHEREGNKRFEGTSVAGSTVSVAHRARVSACFRPDANSRVKWCRDTAHGSCVLCVFSRRSAKPAAQHARRSFPPPRHPFAFSEGLWFSREMFFLTNQSLPPPLAGLLDQDRAPDQSLRHPRGVQGPGEVPRVHDHRGRQGRGRETANTQIRFRKKKHHLAFFWGEENKQKKLTSSFPLAETNRWTPP